LKGRVFAVWNQKLRGGTHTAGVVCFRCDVAGRGAWLCEYGWGDWQADAVVVGDWFQPGRGRYIRRSCRCAVRHCSGLTVFTV